MNASPTTAPRRPRATALAALLTAVTAVSATALPAVAQADSASFDGTTVHVQGGESNDFFTISLARPGVLAATVSEAGPGCEMTVASGVECPIGPGGVVVETYGGDDRISNLSLSDGSLPDGSVRVDLGAGRDEYNGGNGRETVNGGPGNDVVKGAGGDDLLDGGDGNDELYGDGGRDELHGSGGDDLLDGDRYESQAADLLDGGPGSDKAEGWAIPDEDAHPRIAVTVDRGADDGRPGEGDDVRSIERFTSHVSGRIETTDAPDVIEMWANLDYGASTISSAGGDDIVTGGNAAETIDGGAGDDRLEGGFGNDSIVGGPGRDTVYGDKTGGNCGLFESCSMPVGNDTVDVRDGAVDSVSCGVGEDTVTADPQDVVAADCEKVERGSGPGPDPRPDPKPRSGRAAVKLSAAGAPRLAKALKRGLSVRVGGLKPGAKVALSARAAGIRKPVASGRGKAAANGTARVTLRFTAAAKKRLRTARSVRLTVSGGGAKTAVTLRK